MMRPIVSNALRAAARPTRHTLPFAAPILHRQAHGHAQESFEEFSERYVNFFQNAEDLFELQRGLNNCFAHDLVPAPSVVEAAVRAARRINDYGTAVRIFEGIKEKVENKSQYQAYLDELKGVREELGGLVVSFREDVLMDQLVLFPGILVKEELYPESK
ncbi:Cytochrome c oxidase subunit 6 [Marasmius crinis-equi]|uniref:Cytochrome c oxidase subunit 6, mitochondrial n=1 Tax=Marasmius crinis-equi TaxID=585013 RepID=A0ABR3FBT3_9AGAR